VTMGRHGCSRAQEVDVIVQRERERERRSPGFSPMTPLGGGAVEMDTRRRSKECGRCCSSGEMVLGERRRDWSRGGCGG
jgi:hypothetical protein